MHPCAGAQSSGGLTVAAGSGQLSEKELRAALVNGDWTSFDPHTVRMMIRYMSINLCGVATQS